MTDAVAKRIEAETQYKIISSRDRADSVLSGQIVRVGETVLSVERRVGRPMEKEVGVQAVVNWKNLKTGELLIDNQSVSASAKSRRSTSRSIRRAVPAFSNPCISPTNSRISRPLR